MTRPSSFCVSVLGTGSDVGKSVIATALCRIFRNRGFSTAPFKAQNMSNNSGVTLEGLEMGRAQIVQAEAAGVPAHVDMNPVLLKPSADSRSQAVVLGKAVREMSAADFYSQKKRFFDTAARSLDRLRDKHDIIVMEGAGSCAEVNLMESDIVNLSMARHARAPVILTADIHRGGVFAQIVGTLQCLGPDDRDRIAGFIVNRFRGDARLFDGGLKWIEEKTGKPVLGVLPWLDDVVIDPEDSVAVENPPAPDMANLSSPAAAVIRLPRISNFTDFTPLSHLPGLALFFLEKPQKLDPFHAVILPGSKNARRDLEWLKSTGWEAEIKRHAAAGGHILGICGGYQMLGRRLRDPGGADGSPGESAGLGLLPVETEMKRPKITTRVRFSWEGVPGFGYEIHMGRTVRLQGKGVFETIGEDGVGREEGCADASGRIMGVYIHGLFDNPKIIEKWARKTGMGDVGAPDKGGLEWRDGQYERLARRFEAHVDVDAIMEWIPEAIRRGR
ncbi:Cobyric acid synthase [Candidatus Desulfarcum epimagneticum]|uniref:Cobyric acid synthase n=1 Tax=uncultured Desulfobacteraceae bacterium TaxID=218296 RepID=A0A484HDS6_9BACT|nr:Cobyric acid synthase [uncultured Desulfobacteraceae bacterium]